jgi:putative ABC transport system ATP-binding protein
VGTSPRDARSRRDELLAELGLADKGHAAHGELSGGQQQRVAIARALANRPAVLLADEPTGNLDSASAKEVLDVLRREREAGQTILMVTHDARVAAAADRVVTMRDGLAVDETRLGDSRDARNVLSQLIGLEA